MEDEPVVALDMQATLEGDGCELVVCVATVAEALDVTKCQNFDVAFIDLNLNGENGAPVAEALAAQGAKVVFASGYSVPPALAVKYDAAVLMKPFQDSALLGALADALKKA